MPVRKFSPGQVVAIRRRARINKASFDRGEIPLAGYKTLMGRLSQEYFITHSHLSKIINMKIYKDLSDD